MVIYHNMIKHLTTIVGLILLFSVFCSAQSPVGPQAPQAVLGISKYAIKEPSNIWILDLVDSLRNSTTLCVDCMSPPTFKRYHDKYGDVLYRLRYAYDDNSSFIMIYNESGTSIAHCFIDEEINDCNDFEAYTDFTFTSNLMNIWSCKNGFNCVAKDSLGLFRAYEIFASGSECQDKTRELSVDAPFESYEWSTGQGMRSLKSNLMADKSDTYTIQVQDHDGCFDEKSMQIHVYVEKEIPIEGDKILCVGEISSLSSSGFSSYAWSTGDTTSNTVIADAGTVSVTVTNELGCIDSISTEIRKIEGRSIRVRAGEDLFYRDQVIPINLELEGFANTQIHDILWQSLGELTCDDCLTPFGKFTEDSDILAIVTDEHNCSYEHSVLVEPEFAYKEVYGANIFTPDGDGDNDTFMVRSRDGAAIVHQFKVFNRWGVPLHDVGRHLINDESKAWGGMINGNLLPGGVYVYMAEVEFIDGTIEHITGDILLVR